MQIKSYDSFFPTKFRPVTANTNNNQEGQRLSSSNSRSFNLIKKRSNTQHSNGNEVYEVHNNNIFKNNGEFGEFDHEKEKPVGGLDIFMKEHSKKQKTATASSRKFEQSGISIEGKKREYEPEYKSSAFQLQFAEGAEHKTLESKSKSEKVEVYKSHQPYQPAVKIKANGNIARQSFSTSKLNRDQKHTKWVDEQTEKHQNKMSLLGEIFYKKPLVERSGERYFEQLIRNRFEDEPAPPTFIHQVRPFTSENTQTLNSKFFSRLKKNAPNVRNFERLVVKGKHVVAKEFENNFDLD